MISSEKVPSLFPDQQSPSPHTASLHADSVLAAQQHGPSPGQQKVQAIKAKLAQKGNAHSTSLHSFPNRIQCKKTATAASRNYLLASAREAGSLLCRRTHSHEDAWLWQWQWGDSPLIQLIRKVILCFQYETFHTVKSNLKTSWIQSSHTFKRDFIWYWI